MKQNPQDLVRGILDIIHYQEDKDRFVQDFLALCIQETMVVLIKSLPEDDQKNLQVELSQDISPDGMQKVVNAYFSEEKYHATLQQITQDIFNEFVRTASSTANEAEKEKLHNYLRSFTTKN